jgi:hypothetical protein
MKTKNLLFTILLFSASIAFAQVIQSTGDLRAQATNCGDFDALFTNSGQAINNLLYSDVAISSSKATISNTKGSPYLTSTFEKSTLYKNNELLGTFYTRYNAYSKELEVKRTNMQEEKYKALIKDENIRAVFADKEIRYTTFINEKGKKESDYLIVKANGEKYQLFQRMKIKFSRGKVAENSMINNTPNRFINSSDYYLGDINSEIVSYLPSKKSQLLQLFKENEKIQVVSLIKKEGLNLKKEADLITLFQFANTIDREDYAVKGK